VAPRAAAVKTGRDTDTVGEPGGLVGQDVATVMSRSQISGASCGHARTGRTIGKEGEVAAEIAARMPVDRIVVRVFAGKK
jgi:hypothetical protein